MLLLLSSRLGLPGTPPGLRRIDNRPVVPLVRFTLTRVLLVVLVPGRQQQTFLTTYTQTYNGIKKGSSDPKRYPCSKRVAWWPCLA